MFSPGCHTHPYRQGTVCRIEQAIGTKRSEESGVDRFFACKSFLQYEADEQLRRTMETMLLSYPSLIKRLEKEGKPPILLDILQEAGA
jgi:hypothetical protein